MATWHAVIYLQPDVISMATWHAVIYLATQHDAISWEHGMPLSTYNLMSSPLQRGMPLSTWQHNMTSSPWQLDMWLSTCHRNIMSPTRQKHGVVLSTAQSHFPGNAALHHLRGNAILRHLPDNSTLRLSLATLHDVNSLATQRDVIPMTSLTWGGAFWRAVGTWRRGAGQLEAFPVDTVAHGAVALHAPVATVRLALRHERPRHCILGELLGLCLANSFGFSCESNPIGSVGSSGVDLALKRGHGKPF